MTMDISYIKSVCNSTDLKTELPKLKAGESLQFEVILKKGESLEEACDRIANRIGANWWSNEKIFGKETFFSKKK